LLIGLVTSCMGEEVGGPGEAGASMTGRGVLTRSGSLCTAGGEALRPGNEEVFDRGAFNPVLVLDGPLE
jgi:hypothetical protein